jgi:DNA-binding MarR family transcriptional regulator
MLTTPHPFPIGLEIHEISRTLRRLFEALAGRYGFTQEQWRTLWHLSRNEGISQAGLAEILEMQPISLGRLIDRLEAMGLAQRRPHPTDRRAVKLYLTEAAAPRLAEMRAFGIELNEIAASGLSAAEQEMLLSLLRRVRQNVEEYQDLNAPAPRRAGEAR